jgi:hypothetical protein
MIFQVDDFNHRELKISGCQESGERGRNAHLEHGITAQLKFCMMLFVILQSQHYIFVATQNWTTQGVGSNANYGN